MDVWHVVNISGWLPYHLCEDQTQEGVTGVFRESTFTIVNWAPQNGTKQMGWVRPAFKAKIDNALYADGATNQPSALQVLPCIRT